MNELEKYQSVALELAREAEKIDEVPIGAILVHEGKILGQGFNQRETKGKTTAHAEIQALEEYNVTTGKWRLPPGTWVFSTAEPCLMCTGALLCARASRIYYGCSDPKKAGLTTLLPMIEAGTFDHRFEIVHGQILEEECAQLLKEYFRKKRSGGGRVNA